jgi:hypothetical protein
MNIAAPLPKFLLGMWSLYPLLAPFYLMGKTPIPGTEKVEGGVPQLADYYLVGLMVLVFGMLPFRLNRLAVGVVTALVCFVAYTVIINLVWGAALEDLSLAKSSLFYVYDVLLFVTCLVLYANFKEQFLYVTVQAVGVSVVLQALLSPLAPQTLYARQAVFFNNENQLGYFCVVSGTIFVLGARHFSIRMTYQIIFYAALAYLAILSQSRAALLGLGALTIVALLGRPIRLLLAISAAALVLAITLTPPFVSKSEERFVVQGEYDTAAARGYDRIVNYPEHILVGAGEGAYERFRSDLYGSEIHSSFGTLVFCYGIPGTALFALALFFICKSDPRIALYMIPAFVHGLGHQGLRFAPFWAMLAFLCCWAMMQAEVSGKPQDERSDSWGSEPAVPGPVRC